MRTLTYFVASTIDGVIAGPDGGDPSGPDGFFVMEGDHMRDLLSDWPDILPAPARAALGIDAPPTRFDTVLEGRASYQVGLDLGVTDAYPHLEHYVFSRTLTECPDPGVHLVSGDPVETVRELKRRDGLGIWLVGGGTLASALRSEIDELIVKLHPVVAGAGIPLFGGEFGPQRFDLTDVRRFDSGVLYLTYTRR
ncbi:dihydrofolate reductase family protein [Prauserella cavernicola]|uniref:Dihydrofolate reductase family protein n=1 Tax=Prauserella cavernicola TaxID=2800127 RepID=A0A934QMV8_9PSEU|nr:dihydrofolate reductase family protein [Prauserella cavernicola]MBK1782688.1 dihydrofolate reductase family protein [Prauserella cavernicola]